jgi:class 3 adenylate cyclase
VNDIKEFGPTSSLYELLSHLMDKIISGELATFESLKRYADVLPKGQRADAIFRRAFFLQRRLYWGFFKDVSPESFPNVWSQVVIPDRDYPFAGDLKRFMSIPDVYLCMIDIHGYTKYCHDKRHNMSMLDLLDKMLQVDVPRIAAESGVISKRAHGDEVLLLGASATSVLDAVLRIVEYLSKRRRIAEGPAGKPGAGFVLPKFFISAGIAGGQTYTSLVITRDGDISGDLVNTAARLQARANRIAPESNKILLTNHVYQKLKGAGVSIREVDGINKVDFFNTGPIEFKGVKLIVYDTVFLETEAYRLSYRDEMENLYEAIDKEMWKSRIFEVSMTLAARLVANLPGEGKGSVGKRALDASVKMATESFAVERYEKAIDTFGKLVDALSSVPGIDGLAMEYLGAIHENYAAIVESFTANLDRDIDEHLDTLYGQKELERFRLLRQHHSMYGELRESARLKARGRKSVWYREADRIAGELGVRILSRK